jgi:hypothetical protein
MAPMMRKSNRVRSTSDAALLLSQVIALLVRHERDHAARAGATIAFGCRSVNAAATIGSSDALSERGIAALVRLRGRRRVARFAGSIGSSNVAFRGIKPDPATAIQAVTGSGLYDGSAEGDRSLIHLSPWERRSRARAGRRTQITGPMSSLTVLLEHAMASRRLPCWCPTNLRTTFASEKGPSLQAIRRWAVLGSNQ